MLLAIQILITLTSVLSLDIDCTTGITSVKAINSQAYTTNAQIKLELTLTTTQTSLQLIFPTTWSSSTINPIGSTSCAITSDSTTCNLSTSTFTCPLLNTLTKVITCTNVVAPNTNQDIGDLQLKVGTDTCSSIKVSGFLPYGNALTITSSPSTLKPNLGSATDSLVFLWGGLLLPFAFSNGNFVEVTLIDNIKFKSTLTASLGSNGFMLPLTQATKSDTSYKGTTIQAYSKDALLTLQILPLQVLGNTQPISSKIEFRDSSNNLLYSLVFPTLTVQPGTLGVTSLTIENREINVFSKYTFTVTIENVIGSTGTLRIPITQLSTTLTTSCDGTAVTPTINPAYIEIGGCFTTSGTHIIVIQNVKNPSSTSSTITYPYLRTYSNNYIVDELLSYSYTTPPFTSGLLAASYTKTGSQEVGGQSFISISITPKNDIPTNGRLILIIPNQIEFLLGGTYTCNTPCSIVSVTSQQLTLQFTTSIAKDIVTTITGLTVPIRNPYDLSKTSYFTFTTYDVGLNIIDTVNNIEGFQVTTLSSFQSIFTVTPDSFQNGASPLYTIILKFKTAQILPFTLRLQVGDLTVLTPTCSVIGATMSTCSKYSSNTIDFQITGTGLLAADTQLTLILNANSIKNKDSFEISQAFVINTFTSNGGMSQQTGQTVQNNVAGALTATSLNVDKNYYSATDATYQFKFTAANQIKSNYYLQILAPFNIPTSGVSCKDDSNSLLAHTASNNILTITGPFSQSSLTYIVSVSGLPTPADSSAAKAFTIKTFSNTNNQVDQSGSNAFLFGSTCPSTNNCRTCEDATSTNPKCLTCYTATTSIYIYMKDSKCVESCGDGYYLNTSQLACMACTSNCKTCTLVQGVLTCSLCMSNYILQEKSCVSSCGATYYQKTSTDISCSKCDTNCQTCSISSSNCQSCVAGIPWMNNKCYAAGCDVGYYSTSKLGQLTCEKCPTTCIVCQAENQCSVCQENYYKVQGQCVSSCPAGYYPTSTYTCESCLPGCYECREPTVCIKCTTGFFFQANKCVTQCSDTYYNSSDNICSSCGGNCRTCQFIETKTYCLTCLTSYYLLEKAQCVNVCPAGYYQSTETECAKCSDNCQTCKSTSDLCLTCSGGKPYLKGTTCVNECDAGYYPDTASGACAQCPANCQTCTSAVYCTGCLQNQTSTLYLIEGVCKDTCPDKYQPNGLTCTLIPVVNTITPPTRLLPMPFLILEIFLLISVAVAKSHKPETFVPGSFLGLASIFSWGSWVTLILLYYFFYDYKVYYYLILLGGVAMNYLLNFAQLVLFKAKLYPDLEFQRWRAGSLKNSFTTALFSFISFICTFSAIKLIFSRYFGFSFFKAKLTEVNLFFYFNIINGISIVFSLTPIIIGSGFILYYETDRDSQTFISAIDAIAVTLVMILFLLWDTKKDDNYFDEIIPNYQSLNITKIEKYQDSGTFNNTFNNTLHQKDVMLDETKQQQDHPLSVQNKILSEIASRQGGISAIVSDRVSQPLRDPIEKFPYTTRQPQSVKNSKHTIYFNNNVHDLNITDLHIPVDEEDNQGSDPDIEPPKASLESSANFSSIKSHHSDQENPFQEEPNVSVIQDKVEDPEQSQLSIFDQKKNQIPLQQQSFKISTILRTEQAVEQLDWNDIENQSYRSNIQQKETIEQNHSTLSVLKQMKKDSIKQSKKKEIKDQQQQKNDEILEERKINCDQGDYRDNESQNSKNSINSKKSKKSKKSINSKNQLQNSSAHFNQTPLQPEKIQQTINQEVVQPREIVLEQPNTNSIHTPAKSDGNIANRRKASQTYSQIGTNQKPEDSFNIPAHQFDKMSSLASNRFQTKFKSKEPSMPQSPNNHIIQMHVDVEDIDNVDQNNNQNQQQIQIIKDDNAIEDEQFSNNQELQFNQTISQQQGFRPKPKPYKLKVKSESSKVQQEIERVFDSNDSIHTLSEQEWEQNQISPSQYNILNQRYEYDLENAVKQQKKKQIEVEWSDQNNDNEDFDENDFQNQQQVHQQFNNNPNNSNKNKKFHVVRSRKNSQTKQSKHPKSKDTIDALDCERVQF